jgi:hypothetical protein
MKIINTIISILLGISLGAQVNFDFQFNIDYPSTNSILRNIQMIDVNDDDELDIVLFYRYQHDILIKCYNINGEFIIEKTISGNYFDYPNGYLVNRDNDLLIIGEFIEDNELMIKIQDFASNNVVDSLIINDWDHDELFPLSTTDLKAYSYNNVIIILAGVVNITGIYMEETDLYRFVYSDSLQYDQLIQDSGERIYDFTGSDYLVTTGYYWGMDYELYYSEITRYINYISKIDYSSLTYLYQSYGTNTSSISHWPAQFLVLNQNDLHYLDYGLLMQKKVNDSDGNSVNFRNYYPDSTSLIWSTDSTLIGTGYINSSTCVEVNNENHFVMYFRGNLLEIRDRITGAIIHHQDSEICPCYIKSDDSGELLFFVENEEDEILSVYTLAEEIYVSSDDNKIPINDFNSVIWDGNDDSGNLVSSGIYLYKLNVNGNTEAIKKCLLLK